MARRVEGPPRVRKGEALSARASEAVAGDAWGPEYVVRVRDPRLGLEGFLVIDNTARGPGKGGIRMTPDITEGEVLRLARTMTWKTALADLPFGGAKAGIRFSGSARGEKKTLVQGFARAVRPFIPRRYIAGPDVNTGEREMQWFAEAAGNWRSATGKPAGFCMKAFGKPGEKCGIPHEFGSTGFGVAQATKVAAEMLGLDLTATTVAIEGFGNVGRFAFRYLKELGATVVAVADSGGTIYGVRGLDERALVRAKSAGRSVTAAPGGKKLPHDAIFGLPVDVLIPAAVTDAINEQNKDSIRARIIVEGANIPMRETIEEELFRRGIIIVPDIVANAGGVISSYAEYRGYNPKRMFETVEKRVTQTTRRVLAESRRRRMNPRAVALELAIGRVRDAMRERGSPFLR